MTIAEDILDAAKQQFEQRREGPLQALLHAQAELRPPTYGRSWRGGALTGRLLAFAAQAMSEFHYTDALADGDLHILRFEAKVGELKISGVDLVRTDPDGRIVMFEIFARPPKAALAMGEAMARLVGGDPGVLAMMGKD